MNSRATGLIFGVGIVLVGILVMVSIRLVESDRPREATAIPSISGTPTDSPSPASAESEVESAALDTMKADWPAYVSRMCGITFTYPLAWTVSESDYAIEGKSWVLYLAPADEEFSGEGITIGCSQQTLQAAITELDAGMQRVRQSNNKTSLQGIWSVFIYRETASNQEFKFAFLERGSTLLSIAEKNYSENVTVMDTIIQTISF